MKVILFPLLVLVCSAGLPLAQPEKKVFFMFFVKGQGAAPTDAKEAEAVAKTHFSNMGTQVERARLVAAGPLKDPTEVRRGITVLTLSSRGELADTFKGDEFVKRDIMRVEAAEWKVDAKRFNPKVDASTIVEHRLVLLKDGPGKSPVNEEMRKAHRAYLDSLEQTHGLAVWGEVLPSDDRSFQGLREALIFTSTDTSAIERALAVDLFVQRGLLSVEVIPLWMSKGVVRGRSSLP